MPFDIKASLTRKIGPLQTWQWGLVGAGAILVWRRLHTTGVEPARDSTSAGFSGLAGEGALYSTLSGGGAGAQLPASAPPAVEPGFGVGAAPEPFTSFGWGDIYYSGPGSVSPASFADAFAKLFPAPAVTVATPAPAPVPTPAPVQQAAAPSYTPLSPTSIRALFRDFPGAFQGDPEYWVRGLLGTGTPGVTAATAAEWPNFWAAYARAGLG